MSLTRISDKARKQALHTVRKFIPKGARFCRSHLHDNQFKHESLELITTTTAGASYTASQVEDMLNLLMEPEETHNIETMDSKTLKVYTGRTRAEFAELVSAMILTQNYDKKRCKILGVYLKILYAGFVQKEIAVTFMIPRSTVQEYIQPVQSTLESFVKNNLGLTAFTRRTLLEDRTSNVETLYELQETTKVFTI